MNEFLLCNYQKSVCEHSSDFYHNSTCISCMYYIQLLHAFNSEVMCNFYPLHSHTERLNSPYLSSEFLLPSVGETNGLKYKLSWGFISPYILFVLHSFSVRVFRRKFKLISQCWGEGLKQWFLFQPLSPDLFSYQPRFTNHAQSLKMKNSVRPLDNQTWQMEWKTAPLAIVHLCETIVVQPAV